MELKVLISQAVGLRGSPVEAKGTISVRVVSIECLRAALEELFWGAMHDKDFNYYAEVVATVLLEDPVSTMSIRRDTTHSYSPKAWELL